MEIRRATSVAEVLAAGHLFDDTPREDVTATFLAEDRQHLLIAYVDGEPAGFVSGSELLHPDKGVEMFVNELGVDDAFLRRGIGSALVEALLELSKERGCHGMWTAVDADNEAALALYKGVDGDMDTGVAVVTWDLP
ncbi:GNAT family N-acetyltransferase [Saccharothrix violaceirubra]|uniref:Ribosomal protein S18 acetylase RimI-like enzyme n=1 Tax=Saccharothrix violaceirubra TaxID=413306 RepID=A0A7W7TBB2_9PSEU|nr:GNAT family N-acetyltransferase [Saccharothrix violaceirubra]MBB4968670.1 ribosomal protein S18 acetylase RimI-like enzyme [Saccharothrix violaceirubra]